MTDELDVDGPRPAVAWVATIPADWTTHAERLVLIMLAADAYPNGRDGWLTAAPGGDALAGWAGLSRRQTFRVLAALQRATERRPPLLARAGYRERRAVYRLCTNGITTEESRT